MRSLRGYFRLVDQAKLEQTQGSIGFSLLNRRVAILYRKAFWLAILGRTSEALPGNESGDRLVKLLKEKREAQEQQRSIPRLRQGN